MKKITSLIIVAFIFVMLGVYNFVTTDNQFIAGDASAASFKPKTGETAPPQQLPDLNDQSISFGAAQPKLQLVNFWASWCGPCELEAPDLQKIHEKYSESLALYGVNSTKNDHERQARKFVEDFNFTFDILFDRDGDITDLYKVGTFPTSFLIDRQGVIVERINGVITLEQWEKLIEQHL